MKRKMTRKRSGLSAVTALLLMLMLTAVMTLAGTFTVFADDTDPDPGQTNDRIRDVSKKQDITFRGQDPNNGPPPPIPGHGQNNNPDPEDDNIAPTDEKNPDLSEFGSEGGNMYDMYPDDNPDPNAPNNNNDNDHEIDNNSGDGTGPGQEEDQLSSGPVPGEEGKEPSDTKKDKAGDLKLEGAAGTGKNQSETNGNAAVSFADNDNDKSASDETKDSGSADSSPASAGGTGTVSPKTGDDNGLADAMTLFMLSTACLAAMMQGRRNRETDTQDR